MKTKIIPPLIQEDLETEDMGLELLTAAKESDDRISLKLFQNIAADSQDFSGMLFTGVKFVNCRFFECSFEKTEFTDVIFQSCDLSGCDMNDTYINRVEFVSCKGAGTKFTSVNMQHTAIKECLFKYANFDSSKLEHILMEKTDLCSSNITQCRCKDLKWNQVELVNTSFFKTSLRGMDFTTSTIGGLVLSDDCAELKGAIVDMYQAAELSKRLGLHIKEEENTNGKMGGNG